MQDLNLNSLLVKRQIDNPSPGALTGEYQSLALTRDVNLDTLSSDNSEEEIRGSGRSFQSLIVWGGGGEAILRDIFTCRKYLKGQLRSADFCSA